MSDRTKPRQAQREGETFATPFQVRGGWPRFPERKRSTAGLLAALIAGLGLAALAAAADLNHEFIFNIPKQPLAEALADFSRQSDLIVVAPSELTAGKLSNAVKATTTAAKALTLLLEGSQLVYTQDSDGSVVVKRPSKTTLREADPPPSSILTDTRPSAPSSTEQSAGQGAMQLQEVIVTATRRAESVEKVPASIDALSQEELTRGGIKSIADLAAVTPGLQFATPLSSVSSITTIAIRGLNTLTGASVVGLYLDDTPISVRLAPANNMGSPYPAVFDLNRVEVERGPQGTLFGAGSEAGTVRFITNSPSVTEFSGSSHVGLATTERGGLSYEAGAAAGGPIVEDKVGFRVSVWDNRDGGYVDRIDPITGNVVDRNANTDETLALRAALALYANDAVRVTPSVFYQRLRVDDTGSFYGNFSDPSSGHFIGGRLLPARLDDKLFVPSVTIEAHLPFAELTSATSYMNRNARASNDFSSVWGAIGLVNYGSPLGPAFPNNPSDVSPFRIWHSVRAFTQEVRLASNQPDALVTWVAGAFYDHRRQGDLFDQFSVAVDPAAPLISFASEPITDDQIAGFAQGDFHLTNKLTGTLGLRVARVKTDQSNYQSGFLVTGTPPVVHATLTETPITPRAALSYQADRNNLFYVSAGKGFRIGGGNPPVANFCNATIPTTYTSDYVWSYEVGAKNQLFDGRLQIDSSVFHIDWSKIQQLVYLASCGAYYTANAGSAVSNGFDVALQALVTSRLRVNLDVGYTDAYFSSNVYDSAGHPLVLKDDKIGVLPQVNPPWDVNSSATYEIPLPRGDKIRLRGEYQYHSRNPGPFVTHIPTSSGYFPQLVADPPTHLFNARLSATRDKLDLTLYVQNVFNTHPLLSKYQDAPASNLITYNTLRPRTVGLTADLKF
jgi:outer membrane receptor protein involved in Fe transport